MTDLAFQTRQPGADDLGIKIAVDSLHQLPLAAFPLHTPGLKKATLIKNARMETVVELYRTKSHGSGHVQMNQLDRIFPSYQEQLKEDMVLMNALSALPSFDVFSLRIALRRLGISVNDVDFLKLSDRTRDRLAGYMHEFTKPLITKIYGDDQCAISTLEDVVKAFASPDRQAALQNLKNLSAKLNVQLDEIPKFIEEYGDIFLAVAYFRSNLEGTSVDVANCIAWMKEIHRSLEVNKKPEILQTFRKVEDTMEEMNHSLNRRMEFFGLCFQHFWKDVNMQSFHDIKRLVMSNYENLGGILCGLSVKMESWKTSFPRGGGSPNMRADFVLTEIVPGLNALKKLEQAAPRLMH